MGVTCSASAANSGVTQGIKYTENQYEIDDKIAANFRPTTLHQSSPRRGRPSPRSCCRSGTIPLLPRALCQGSWRVTKSLRVRCVCVCVCVFVCVCACGRFSQSYKESQGAMCVYVCVCMSMWTILAALQRVSGCDVRVCLCVCVCVCVHEHVDDSCSVTKSLRVRWREPGDEEWGSGWPGARLTEGREKERGGRVCVWDRVWRGRHACARAHTHTHQAT